MRKVRLIGIRQYNRLYLSGMARVGINQKKIPPFFTIEVDLDSVKSREKSKESR